jgi:hypothetical protein
VTGREDDRVTSTPEDASGATWACGVAASGAVEASSEQLRALVKRLPLTADAPPLAGLLRYTDEQTTAAIAAVGGAIDAAGLGSTAFADWGAATAPRVPGRTQAAAAIAKFRRQGALSVTPLIVPYMSLNSQANVLSLALGMRGPCIGVGGGPDHLAEGLRAGLALMSDGGLPGAWVVLSELDPDPPLDADGRPTAPYVCRAVALALTPAPAGAGRLFLRPGAAADGPAPRLADLAEFIAGPHESDRWIFPLAEGGFIEWARAAGCAPRAAAA